MNKIPLSMLQVVIMSVVTFAFLLTLTRLLGKKQMSQLTYFNYITGITIGTLAANMILSSWDDFFKLAAALLTWGLVTFVVAFLSLKSRRARTLTDGQPTIVIKEGEISKKGLLSVRMNIDELMMLLRQENIFSCKDVDYAILENNGKLSVLKKIEQQTVTKQDMNLPTSAPRFFPIALIMDGKIIHHNLKEAGIDEGRVMKWLRKEKVESVEEVLYAELQEDGSIYIASNRDDS